MIRRQAGRHTELAERPALGVCCQRPGRGVWDLQRPDRGDRCSAAEKGFLLWSVFLVQLLRGSNSPFIGFASGRALQVVQFVLDVIVGWLWILRQEPDCRLPVRISFFGRLLFVQPLNESV